MELALQQEKAKQLRADIVKMTYLAKSGHPGGSLSCVEMLMALYYNIMKVDPSNPGWEERDRFVLSKGHACPALYAVLADKGYFPRETSGRCASSTAICRAIPICARPRVWTPTPARWARAFPLPAGMALAAKYKGESHRVFVITGDGESQEGLVWEAAMSAAHYKLDNLTVLLDHNGLQIDGTNDEVMGVGDMMAKYEAFGFACVKVDGHDIGAVVEAVNTPHPGKPLFVCCETHKGHGVSFMEDQVGWHGKAPNKEQYEQAMKELGVSDNG